MAIFILPRMNSLSAAQAQIQDFNKPKLIDLEPGLLEQDRKAFEQARFSLSSSPLGKNQASGVDFKLAKLTFRRGGPRNQPGVGFRVFTFTGIGSTAAG